MLSHVIGRHARKAGVNFCLGHKAENGGSHTLTNLGAVVWQEPSGNGTRCCSAAEAEGLGRCVVLDGEATVSPTTWRHSDAHRDDQAAATVLTAIDHLRLCRMCARRRLVRMSRKRARGRTGTRGSTPASSAGHRAVAEAMRLARKTRRGSTTCRLLHLSPRGGRVSSRCARQTRSRVNSPPRARE